MSDESAHATQPIPRPSESISTKWPSSPTASSETSSSRPRRVERAEAEHGRDEGSRRDPSPELLAEHRHLDHAESETTFGFRHLDPEPALFGHRTPEIGIERLGDVRSPSVLGRPGPDEGADPFARGHPVEEVGRGLREGALIAGELELHGDEAYEPHAPVGPARQTLPRPVTS